MGLWSQVEAALVAWVTSALPNGWGCIFAEQQGGAQEGPYVTIRIGDVKGLGACDEEIYAYNGGTAPNDLTITETGEREFPVSIQAYGGKGQTTGDNSPRAVLSIVRQALELPNTRAALEAVGLSPFDNRGPVRNVSTVAGTIFEPRALFECRFYLVEQLAATTTYIATVDSGVTNPGAQQEIPFTPAGALPNNVPVPIQ
jgi:hypothetical protein